MRQCLRAGGAVQGHNDLGGREGCLSTTSYCAVATDDLYVQVTAVRLLAEGTVVQLVEGGERGTVQVDEGRSYSRTGRRRR